MFHLVWAGFAHRSAADSWVWSHGSKAGFQENKSKSVRVLSTPMSILQTNTVTGPCQLKGRLDVKSSWHRQYHILKDHGSREWEKIVAFPV